MCRNIFSCHPIENGYTWTIVSLLGDMLAEIEERYGPRDRSFTILGIEATAIDRPQIWFPGNRENIIIQVTSDSMYDIDEAVYQVAHEAVHCLNPVKSGAATWLEEGLATWFARQYSLGRGVDKRPTDEKYAEAMLRVETLLTCNTDVVRRIRMQHGKTLSDIPAELLLKECPHIGWDAAHLLTSKF